MIDNVITVMMVEDIESVTMVDCVVTVAIGDDVASVEMIDISDR